MAKKTYKDKTINAEGFYRIAKETLSTQNYNLIW